MQQLFILHQLIDQIPLQSEEVRQPRGAEVFYAPHSLLFQSSNNASNEVLLTVTPSLVTRGAGSVLWTKFLIIFIS